MRVFIIPDLWFQGKDLANQFQGKYILSSTLGFWHVLYGTIEYLLRPFLPCSPSVIIRNSSHDRICTNLYNPQVELSDL